MAATRNAAKNGIVLVVDLELQSVSKAQQKPAKPLLPLMKECVSLIIRNKIFLESRDDVAVLLCGVEESGTAIHHVDDMKPVGWQLLASFLRCLDRPEKAVRTAGRGLWLQGVAEALDLLASRTADGVAYDRTQVFVFSAFPTPTAGGGGAAALESRLRADLVRSGTELVVLMADTDGQAALGQELALRLVEQTNGAVCDYEDLLARVIYTQERTVKPSAWNATLDIGDAVRIPVSGYVKVKEHDHLKWKMPWRRGATDASAVTGDDIVYGYKYGSEFFTFSGDEEGELKSNSGDKSLALVAFVDAASVDASLYTGTNTMYFFGQKNAGIPSREAQLGVSALVQALEAESKVALVRRVLIRNARARLGVLAPRTKPHYQCLVFHELPYGDEFRWPGLVPLEPQPTAQQLDAVDRLIDRLDLSQLRSRGEFAFDAKELYDPHSQFLMHLVASRAVSPEAPIPPVPPHIRRLVEAPESLTALASDVMELLRGHLGRHPPTDPAFKSETVIAYQLLVVE